MLVVAQIAISLLMLVAAGLFVRTLSNLHSIELGFDRENVLLFQVDARKAGYKDRRLPPFTAICSSGSARFPACAARVWADFAHRGRECMPISVPARHPIRPTATSPSDRDFRDDADSDPGRP